MPKRIEAQSGNIEFVLSDATGDFNVSVQDGDINLGTDGNFTGIVNLGTKLSFNESTGTLSFPSNTTDVKISGDESDIVTFRNTTISTDAATLTFTDDPSGYDTITRAGGVSDFITEGFIPGMMVTISGSVSNDGTYSIDEEGVTATTLTLIFDDALTTEGPVAATMVGLVREASIDNATALKLNSLDGTFKTTIRHKENAWLEIRDPDKNGAGIFTYGSSTLGIYDANETVSQPPVNTDTTYITFAGYGTGDYQLWEIGTFNVADMGLSLNNYVPGAAIQGYVTDITNTFYRFLWDGDYANGMSFYWPTSNAVAFTTDAAGIYSPLGSLYLEEKATPGADTLTRGQLWVRNDNPSTLMFTDGDSTDFVVAGGGVPTVFSTGTPADNQVAVWTATTNTLEGDANFTWDGTALTVAATSGRLILPQTANANAAPTLAFGDGDTGFYEDLDDQLMVAIEGFDKYVTAGTAMESAVGTGGFSIQFDAATSTNPIYAINNDTDTGIGWAAQDQLSLIAGAVEGIRLTEASSSVIQTHEANVGLTADVGSAQGSGVITSSYNVYSTVANPGDAATLPSTFPVGTIIYVKNDGANPMDVFPASGDDAGEGVDAPVVVQSSSSVTFIATAADSTWTPIISSSAGAVSPVYEIDVNDTFDSANAGKLWHKDSGGAVTFTCDNDSSIQQGTMWLVHNDDTEDLTIAQGTGVTISFLASGAAPVTGNVTVEQGGFVTVYKYTDTEYWVWGDDGPFNLVTAGATTDSILRWDGTSWVENTTIQATSAGSLYLAEQADASADIAGYGQLWVDLATPNILNFTDDTGQDIQISPNRATVQTTDATQTEIISIPIASGTMSGFEIHLSGHESATGDSVFERVFGAIRNQGGTTALVGSTVVDRTADTGAAAWTITVAADDGTDALTVDVTGEASHTIDWKVSVEVLGV